MHSKTFKRHCAYITKMESILQKLTLFRNRFTSTKPNLAIVYTFIRVNLDRFIRVQPTRQRRNKEFRQDARILSLEFCSRIAAYLCTTDFRDTTEREEKTQTVIREPHIDLRLSGRGGLLARCFCARRHLPRNTIWSAHVRGHAGENSRSATST